jgi:hypothetical protein
MLPHIIQQSNYDTDFKFQGFTSHCYLQKPLLTVQTNQFFSVSQWKLPNCGEFNIKMLALILRNLHVLGKVNNF